MDKCNYCNLKDFEAKALAEGKELTIEKDPFGPWQTAVNVYIHPSGKKLNNYNRTRYHMCWMAKVPAKCCCEVIDNGKTGKATA